MKQRLERGKQWLLHAEPVILEDMDMRLVGVAAAGASAAELRKLAEPILALQRSGRRLGAAPRISERRLCHRHDVVGSE